MKSTHKKRNVHGQRKKLASPNARDTNMLVFFALGNAKVLSFVLGDAKVPNANGFASQWNISFRYWKGDGKVTFTKPCLILGKVTFDAHVNILEMYCKGGI